MIWKVMRKFEFENVKEWVCDEKKRHRIKLMFLGDSALDLSLEIKSEITYFLQEKTY